MTLLICGSILILKIWIFVMRISYLFYCLVFFFSKTLSNYQNLIKYIFRFLNVLSNISSPLRNSSYIKKPENISNIYLKVLKIKQETKYLYVLHYILRIYYIIIL